MATKCGSTNQAGQPCGAVPYRDGWCRWHHPDLAEQRRAWSAKGGASRSNRARAAKALPAQAMSLEEVRGALSVALKGVLGGRLEPGVANAVAALGRALVTVTEASDLEKRIGELEAAAGIVRLGGKRA